MNNTFSNSAHSGYDIIPLFLQKQNIAISRVQSDACVYKPEPLIYFPNRLMWDTKGKRNHCLSSPSGQQSTNKEAFMPRFRIDWRSVSFVFSVLEKWSPLWKSLYGLGFLFWFVFFFSGKIHFFKIFINANTELIY